MSALDPCIADRLAKLLGMLGSDHDGERASAARKADQLVREHGLRWPDVIASSSSSTMADSSIEELIDFALDHGKHRLTAWEEGFLRGIGGRQHLTKKQINKLRDIAENVASFRQGYSS